LGIARNFNVNATLQQALNAWNGKLPDGIDLALAGHMHTFELLSFEDKRAPQIIIGTGGTHLDKKIKRWLTGTKIGSAIVRDGRVQHGWGFIMLMPHPNGTDWTVTFRTVQGKCQIRLHGQTDARPFVGCIEVDRSLVSKSPSSVSPIRHSGRLVGICFIGITRPLPHEVI
jgi:hypothetical protein